MVFTLKRPYRSFTQDSAMSSATYKPDAKGGGIGRTMGTYLDPALTWADLAWLRGLIPAWMKLGVKGVQSAEVSLKQCCSERVVSNDLCRMLC